MGLSGEVTAFHGTTQDDYMDENHQIKGIFANSTCARKERPQLEKRLGTGDGDVTSIVDRFKETDVIQRPDGPRDVVANDKTKDFLHGPNHLKALKGQTDFVEPHVDPRSGLPTGLDRTPG